MTTPEGATPKVKLKKWQIVVLILVALAVIGSLSGGSSSTSSSSTSSTPKADIGTEMACSHWRSNLAEASTQTAEQQIAGAQQVYKYSRTSENPTIVEYGKKMAEDMVAGDAQAYLADGTAFGNACIAAGQ